MKRAEQLLVTCNVQVQRAVYEALHNKNAVRICTQQVSKGQRSLFFFARP